MQKIVIFGKGGVGKSTVSANLAAIYNQLGKKLLLIGCDPKHDTALGLTSQNISTFVDSPLFSNEGKLEDIIVELRKGIDCLEAGGPEPGVGCAGRGVSKMLEVLENSGLLKSKQYDIVLFDILADVVCGGFAHPLRKGIGQKVCIVVSEELASLYAANNIAKAVKNYSSNGISLLGLIANIKNPKSLKSKTILKRFAKEIGTEILTFLWYDPKVQEAASRFCPVVEYAPSAPISQVFKKLAKKIYESNSKTIPHPLSDVKFQDLARSDFEKRKRVSDFIQNPIATCKKEDSFMAEVLNQKESNDWKDFIRHNLHDDLEDSYQLTSKKDIVFVDHGDLECKFSHFQEDGQTIPFFDFPWLSFSSSASKSYGKNPPPQKRSRSSS